MIEISNAVPSERLHHPRHAAFPFWRDQQMDMIGHQCPRMNGNLAFSGAFIQPVHISGKIFVRSKTNLTIVTALDFVLRDPRQTDPS
jgi:hypothetical protein